MTEIKKGKLKVRVFDTRPLMGAAAASEVADRIGELLKTKEHVNIIFASAPSQNEFLASLKDKNVEWSRVNAFHMDEYVGLPGDAPQGFGFFLRERLFRFHTFHTVNYINGNHPHPLQECERYASLLRQYPTDIVILGIGENTHLAFNDPHVAFFDDPRIVKIVDLDDTCRQQQVNDGCFTEMDSVPVYAITITIPPLFQSKYAYAIAPGLQKANAIAHTANSPIAETHPSTILRNHRNAMLYTDANGASKILEPSSAN